ncbi:MAG: patatin-like phospholipase RssA [Gammaproteobacteria bacterium]|nr:patatin-like phospholipase RssA [Gammaproteobacteria bacterium]
MKYGLALGSGSARGWSHIGVLRALGERGIRPSVVSGSSTGSLVAAAYASGQLDALEKWARTLTKMDVWRLLDASFKGGGVMRGNRLMRAVGEQLEDRPIESLQHRFGAVAVDLNTGQEIWIQQGSMLGAVRASSGLPGLFTPALHDGRWVIDGGVVNPVPVSLCRAMGADFVIAVNVNKPVIRSARTQTEPGKEVAEQGSTASVERNELFARWLGLLDDFVRSIRSEQEISEPGMMEVMYGTISIMQDQIMRSRLIGDPPDVIVRPAVTDFHMMDFHRAAEAIDIGHAAVAEVAERLPRHD